MKYYNFEMLKKDIQILAQSFPQMEWGSIGKSVWGRELYYIRLGYGKKKISYNGAHHGMEWITAAMLMKFAKEFLAAQQTNECLCGFSVEAMCKKASLYIIPMLNPDGVELSTKGLPQWLTIDESERLIQYNGSEDFTRWQANAKGVDLNHNYDAMWQQSKAMEKEHGIWGPGPTRFSGEFPLSEPESSALAEFTVEHNFDMVLAFHSQGKVIYQGFQGKEPPVSVKIANAFELISPYKLDTTEGIASYGGYKDWFVDRFRRPGFTIEVGEGINPLPFETLPIIYKETLPLLLGAMTV